MKLADGRAVLSCVLLMGLLLMVDGSVSSGRRSRSDNSCQGRCGGGHDTNKPCQCNTHCTTHRDCCPDYQAVCGRRSRSDNSCQGRCGGGHDTNKPCQCNTHCTTHRDCCPDYQAVCVGTCEGRCGFGTDSTKPCQCNGPCAQFNDCCHDYQQVCTSVGGGAVTCDDFADSFTDVTEYFWNHDVNGLTSSQYMVNWQSSVRFGNSVDRAPSKFFSWVDQAAFNSRPTFTAFVRLLDNYNSFIGTADNLSVAEKAEIDNFYRLIRATAIFNKLYTYLKCTGKVSGESEFKAKFYNLWFDLYPRSGSASSALDSSGFEHVLVGELARSRSVSGFHNWIQFYEEERYNRINYYGYVKRVLPYLVSANFVWKPPHSSSNSLKDLGSFFIGTSPEFDLALYTLCAFQFSNAVCRVRLGGVNYRIKTYDVRHKEGLQIGSAHPVI